MITKNAKNFIKLCNTHKGNSKFDIPSGILKDASGTICTYCYGTLGNPFANTASIATKLQADESHGANSGLYLRFGTGTTAPTELDYCLESEIADYSVITSVKNSSTYSSSFNEDGTKFITTLVINMVLQNIGTVDLQINELGITKGLHRFTGATGISAYDSILLYREVLAEPITVVPQGVFSVTKTVSVEQDTGYEVLVNS